MLKERRTFSIEPVSLSFRESMSKSRIPIEAERAAASPPTGGKRG
jgi:hypothetical protein